MSKRQFLEDMVQSIMENKIETAREKFHQYVVESAREIHASLIETDELEDDIDETVEESFEVVEADSEETTDFGADVSAEGDDMGEMGGEMDPDHDGDDDTMGDHVEVEMSELDQVKALLADLQAKFAEITGEEAPGAEEAGEDMDLDGGEVVDGEVEESVFESDDMDSDDQEGDKDETMEESTDFDLTEEDLLGLEEGWSEVHVKMDGGELDGKFAGGEKNTKTPLADKTEESVKAEDMVSKKDNHKGYEREKAPAVAPAKTHATNIMTSGKKAWTGVTAKMDGAEQGHGKFATPGKTVHTPVAGKK